MFKVTASGPYQYVGGSEKLAEEFYAACIRAGMCVIMWRIVMGEYIEVKEHIA